MKMLMLILHLQWARQCAKFWGQRSDSCFQNSKSSQEATEEMVIIIQYVPS